MFIKDGKPFFDDIIKWLDDNSIQWSKARAEAHVLKLTEREQLLLCISYYAWQHTVDLKQLHELYAKHGTLI